MAKAEVGVAIVSVLIVAGVLAIPLAVTAPVGVPATIQRLTPSPTPTSTALAGSGGELVGSGCAAYAAQVPSGPGSIAGMTQSPFAVAASNNPMLTTLTSAISGKLNPNVNLVTMIDNAQFTVFAPVDSAFAKMSASTLASLKLPANSAKLTSLLEYHIVPGERQPASIDGTLNSLEGGTLTVAGSGDDITVNGAGMVCGGIQTQNAVVYLINTVLAPPVK